MTSLPPRFPYPSAAFYAFALSACSAFGGQTGEGDESGPGCADAEPVAVAMTEMPMGFSAEEVLAFAEAPQGLTVSWTTLPDGSPLASGTLLVTRRGSTARFVDSEIDRDAPLLTDLCADRLEMDVGVELEVSDATGAFHASFETVLMARSRDYARFFAQVEPGSVTGDSRAVLSQGEVVGSFIASVALSPLRSSGVFNAVAERTEYPADYGAEPQGDAPRAGPYTVERELPLAAWPANSACAPPELPVLVDESLFATTPRAALDWLSFEAPLTWEGGGATTVRFTAAPRTESACLASGCPEWCELVDYRAVAQSDQPLFGVESTVSVTTDDGRWNGQLDAIAQVLPVPSGGVRRLWIAHHQTYASPEAFQSGTGLSSLPLAEGQAAMFNLTLLVDVVDGGAATTGTISAGNASADSCADGTPCAGPVGAVPLVARFGDTSR